MHKAHGEANQHVRHPPTQKTPQACHHTIHDAAFCGPISPRARRSPAPLAAGQRLYASRQRFYAESHTLWWRAPQSTPKHPKAPQGPPGFLGVLIAAVPPGSLPKGTRVLVIPQSAGPCRRATDPSRSATWCPCSTNPAGLRAARESDRGP